MDFITTYFLSSHPQSGIYLYFTLSSFILALFLRFSLCSNVAFLQKNTGKISEIPELMILDITLPDGDGFSLFRNLHAKADVPALFLSARDADEDRLFGLGLGADDYLTKPFLMQELLLRVQHIL